jgi:sterol 24-C-methyltransferase
MNRSDKLEYLQEVRRYYDVVTPAYLQCMGTSLQGGRIRVTNAEPDAKTSNLYMALQAGIQAGDRVLDAGCGVCGPSIDIAQAITDLHINAITLSPVQASIGKSLIHQVGMADHIQIAIADYHSLPFCGAIFDRVVFFESVEYSYDRNQLFVEVYRVLRLGGTLYVKSVFKEDRPLTNDEQRVLAEAEKVYALRLATMRDTELAIKWAGFKGVISRTLDDIISTDHYAKAMVREEGNYTMFTELGKLHIRPTTMHLRSPIHYGEIKAYK